MIDLIEKRGIKKEETPATSYFSVPVGESIIADVVLDCQVRNGAGYNHHSIITGERRT